MMIFYLSLFDDITSHLGDYFLVKKWKIRLFSHEWVIFIVVLSRGNICYLHPYFNAVSDMSAREAHENRPKLLLPSYLWTIFTP
jgi:hypothetical protein